MDLSIIIVNWNSLAHLNKCLASIYENTRGLEFEVIVVDNASFDGSGELIASRFPQAQFIQSQTNLGFACANNLGFAQSSGRALLFLNPDTEVIGDALPALFATLERVGDAGVVGAKLLNSDGTVQTSCIQRFPSILNQAIDAEPLRNAFPKLRVWGTWPLLEKQPAPVAVDVISGACMIVKRSTFEQVGLFSTDYFMYSEDVDLCFKFWQAGFKNYYVDDAVVTHHGGASSSANGQSHFSAVVMRDSIFKFFVLRRGGLYAMAYRATVVLVSIVRCTLLGGGLLLSRQDRLGNALSRWGAVLRWGMGMRRGRTACVASVAK
jgi:GT2 family glycosyltransferase